jgi:hypothetical protein
MKHGTLPVCHHFQEMNDPSLSSVHFFLYDVIFKKIEYTKNKPLTYNLYFYDNHL